MRPGRDWQALVRAPRLHGVAGAASASRFFAAASRLRAERSRGLRRSAGNKLRLLVGGHDCPEPRDLSRPPVDPRPSRDLLEGARSRVPVRSPVAARRGRARRSGATGVDPRRLGRGLALAIVAFFVTRATGAARAATRALRRGRRALGCRRGARSPAPGSCRRRPRRLSPGQPGAGIHGHRMNRRRARARSLARARRTARSPLALRATRARVPGFVRCLVWRRPAVDCPRAPRRGRRRPSPRSAPRARVPGPRTTGPKAAPGRRGAPAAAALRRRPRRPAVVPPRCYPGRPVAPPCQRRSSAASS